MTICRDRTSFQRHCKNVNTKCDTSRYSKHHNRKEQEDYRHDEIWT